MPEYLFTPAALNRCAFCLLLTILIHSASGLDSAGSDWPFPAMAVNSVITINDDWRFTSDPHDQGLDEGWYRPDFDHDRWSQTTVPGVWNHPRGEVPLTAVDQVGWYTRKLPIPKETEGEAALVFLAVMHTADVWLNGEYLGGNRGGYTPFLISLPPELSRADSRRLTIRVDSRLSNRSIPKARTGWQTYGGITREVFLITRPHRRIDNLRSMTELDATDGSARLSLSGTITNRSSADLQDELTIVLKAGGQIRARTTVEAVVTAGTDRDFKTTMYVPGARLWSPDDPFLHTLEISWTSSKQVHLTKPIGLRQIRIEGKHFLLNGERLWLQGFGQHEMAPGHGPAPPPELHARRMQRIKNFGANHYRTGHYPQHPAVYAAADRLGLLVFTEIPVWQADRRWLQIGQAWREWAEPQLEAMLQWYGNFTSIVSWGVANETWETPDYFRRATEFVRINDPTRLPMIVMDAAKEPSVYALTPMAGRNLHYGMYHSQRVYGLRNGLARNLGYAEQADVPIWVAELGAQAYPGRFTGGYHDDTRGSETYLDKLIRFGFQYCAVSSDRIAGIAIWTWTDFIRGGRIEPHGIFGFNGEPKLAAYTARNLFAGDLRLFLTEEDTSCRPGQRFRADAFVFNPLRQVLPPGLKIEWRIMQGAATLASDVLDVPADNRERAIPIAEITWAIPENATGMYTLHAELKHDTGEPVHANSIHFGSGNAAPPGVLFLNVTARGAAVEAAVKLGKARFPVYADPGLIIPLPEGEYRLKVVYQDQQQPIEIAVRSGKPISATVEFE